MLKLRETLSVPGDYSPLEVKAFMAGVVAGNNHARIDVDELVEYAKEVAAEREARNDSTWAKVPEGYKPL